MKFYQTVLSNGLTIIGEQSSASSSSSLGFFVKTGSRDEQSQVSGVSHFLEHMMFKGTKKRSALEITYDLGKLGAQANAFTSEENTVYYAKVLPEHLIETLELFADMLRPALDQKEFDTEKKVILEEIALYQDKPTFVLFETAMSKYFGNHPAGNSVLGTNDSIGELTSEQMREYFISRYAPRNMVLAVSGDFDWDIFVEKAESFCGDWEDVRVDPRSYPIHEVKELDFTLTKKGLQRAHRNLICRGPEEQSDLKYNLKVLSTILGDSSGSKSYWQLVDPGIADYASIDLDTMDKTGLVYAYVSSSPEKLEEATSVMLSIMQDATNWDAEELARAKNKLKTRLVLASEDNMRRLMNIGLRWLYSKNYLSLSEEIAKYDRIQRADVENALSSFSFKPTTVVSYLPE